MNRSAQKILIIDDHPIFADGLVLILQTRYDDVHIESVDSAQKVLANRELLKEFDLILVDLKMPDLDGFGFLTALREQEEHINVAVISGSQKKAEIERAISLGARGFIPKNSSSDELLRAIEKLLGNEFYLPERWRKHVNWVDGQYRNDVDKNVASQALTARQLQVLELMKDGLKNKQIAETLGISTSAVKGHIENMFKQLGVNNRTTCVLIAGEKGLI